jgi:hypothetical protein
MNFKSKSFWIGPLAGVLIIVGGGLAYGHFSQRWGSPPNLLAAAAHLEELPDRLGDWQLQKEEPMSEDVQRMLQCAGYVNRTYVNQKTGDSIYLAIIVGPPGPTSVHTPEICFSSRNYSIAHERERILISGSNAGGHSFWNTAFESNNAVAERLSVFFAWSDGGPWTAATSPRFEFAAAPKLFKIQLACHTDEKATAEENSGADFLRALLNSPWSTGIEEG